MEKQTIDLGTVTLQWSDWFPWDSIKADARFPGGISIPNFKSGVYEVIRKGEEKRLTIGKASNLRMRIRQGLVKGKTKHSAGTKIRRNENTSLLLVRWAETEKPAGVEEHLHRLYVERFGEWPFCTDHT